MNHCYCSSLRASLVADIIPQRCSGISDIVATLPTTSDGAVPSGWLCIALGVGGYGVRRQVLTRSPRHAPLGRVTLLVKKITHPDRHLRPHGDKNTSRGYMSVIFKGSSNAVTPGFGSSTSSHF